MQRLSPEAGSLVPLPAAAAAAAVDGVVVAAAFAAGVDAGGAVGYGAGPDGSWDHDGGTEEAPHCP